MRGASYSIFYSLLLAVILLSPVVIVLILNRIGGLMAEVRIMLLTLFSILLIWKITEQNGNSIYDIIVMVVALVVVFCLISSRKSMEAKKEARGMNDSQGLELKINIVLRCTMIQGATRSGTGQTILRR